MIKPLVISSYKMYPSLSSVSFGLYSILIWILTNINSCIYNFGKSVRRSSQLAFGRSTGNNVSGHYKRHSFPFIFFPFLFSPSWRFLIEGVFGSKNLFCESCQKRPKTWGKRPFQAPSAIMGPPSGDFRLWRRCCVAGGERVPPAPLGW